jgi:hypothetical protein
MRLFRQRKTGDWVGLVEQLAEALRAWCREQGAPR